MIDHFNRKYFFLSNFYECPVFYEGLVYNSTEAAFQAAKILSGREYFTKMNPPAAKKEGRRVNLREDWEEVKMGVMYDVCYVKFAFNPILKEKLLKTGDRHLEEANHHGDMIWGTVDGEGENNLGKILMQIREDLADGVKSDLTGFKSFDEFALFNDSKNEDSEISQDASSVSQNPGCKAGFDAEAVKNDLIEWIQEFFRENGPDCNAIVGISGGKDSSTVAALCVEALGRDRVIGVLMPNHVQKDINAAQKLVEHLGIENHTINIRDSFNGIISQMEQNGIEVSEQTRINLPPRIRMAALYAVSQSNHGRVANTCNLSEDWVGYATRYGDGAGDFSPLSKLTVAEVKEIGRSLNLPDELVDKVPIDGLSNKTDEDNLGFTYDVLDRYIRTGEIEDKKIKEKIDYLHELNKFKLELMPHFEF